VRLALSHLRGVDRLLDLEPHLGGQRRVPAEDGVVVVRPGVHDGVLAVVHRRVHVRRIVGAEPELEHDHARVAERGAQPLDRSGDDAEVLGDHRQLPELARRGVERRPARPALPAAAERMPGALRHGPIGAEAAEVVDPREVVELEGAAQPLGPPAIAAPLQRRPVVERVAPQLSLVGVGVRRGARHRVVAEQLGMRAVVDRAGRDVDRHIADQPHAGRLRVRAQRRPLAIEAHLVGDRAATRPVIDPERVALAEVELGLARHRCPRVGQQTRPRRERRRGLVRRAVPIRRPQRQHLPPRLSRLRQPIDETERLATEATAGE
jgi:hypothetical protein